MSTTTGDGTWYRWDGLPRQLPVRPPTWLHRNARRLLIAVTLAAGPGCLAAHLWSPDVARGYSLTLAVVATVAALVEWVAVALRRRARRTEP